MDKKILMAIATVLILAIFSSTASAAWTGGCIVDVNGGYETQATDFGTPNLDKAEDGFQCVPDDGNFSISLRHCRGTPTPVTSMGTGISVVFYGAAGLADVTPTQYGHAHNDANGFNSKGAADNDGNVSTNIHGYGAFSVAAPTTEGSYLLCVQDDNAFDVNKYCEWVTVQPDSTYSEVTFASSVDTNDFCGGVTYGTYKGSIATAYGSIETVEGRTMDFSGDIDFDAGITMTKSNELAFNLSNFKNKRMKITFLKPEIRTSQFQIRRNDSGCSTCENISSNNGQISFTSNSVNDSLTKYSVVEVSTGDDTTGGGGLPIGGGTFQAALPSLAGLTDTTTVLLGVGVVIVLIGAIAIYKKR